MLPAGQLASAAAKFFRAAPWQHWHSDLPMTFEASGAVAQTFEGCLMGNAGQEYGVALYEEKGAIEKLLKLHDEEGKPSAAKQVSCISVTFDAAPDFAVSFDGLNPSIPAGSGRQFAVRVERLTNRVDLHLALGGGFEPPPPAPEDSQPASKVISK